MKKTAGILGILGILVLVVFVSGCTSSNNSTTNQSNQNVSVMVNSNTSWNGTITYNGSDHNVSGTGNKNYTLGTSPGTVTVYMKNNNSGQLTVELLQGTKVIQNQSTSVSQEVVSLSHNF
jgi:hypothetical protein